MSVQSRAIVLTDAERKRAIEMARKGVSGEGVANACGISYKTLTRIFAREPEFESAFLRAVSEYEVELVEASNGGDEWAEKRLTRRFPSRHGHDPRWRISRDRYAEDEGDVAAPTNDAVTIEAIETFIAMRKEGKA